MCSMDKHAEASLDMIATQTTGHNPHHKPFGKQSIIQAAPQCQIYTLTLVVHTPSFKQLAKVMSLQ